MPRKNLFLVILALLTAVIVAGCGASPTPTKVPPTQASQVVTIVITATPPVATPTSLPTPTIMPTAVMTVTEALPTPSKAPVTPRPAATKKPTTPPSSPTAAPVALKYAAPVFIGPVYNSNRKDERHYPGDALIFQWQSVEPLQGNECYLVRVDMIPGQGDSFMQCDSSATQVGRGLVASFKLNQPRVGGVNYGNLLPTTAGETMVNWTVQVVRDDGASTGAGALGQDGSRHKTTPLSPKSDTAQFPLKGG